MPDATETHSRFRTLWHKVAERLKDDLNDYCETLLEVDKKDYLDKGSNEEVRKKVREAMLFRLESIIEYERGSDDLLDEARDLLDLR